MKHKKAAMEMSVGTIVTIVLLMTVLVLGLVLVRTIFKGAVENIDGIDQAVKGEINKLFSEDSSRKIVVYPATRKINIKKGEDNLGFGFSIRNVKEESDSFSYEITAVETSCGIKYDQAENLIDLGRTRTNIQLPPGTFMDQPIFVRFGVPETTPPCQIRYQIQVYHEGKTPYSPPIDVDLKIESQ
ncbi:hypothetical protein K9L16_02175 [Candidatus Pacearchaeota archaeon]|nr:hypothetical protein [Candidatus Pacearchaeota archaeon]